MNEDVIRKIDAWLQYHFKEDPDKWDDDTWALKWQNLKYVLQELNKDSK